MSSNIRVFPVAAAIVIVLAVISSQLDAAQVQLSWTAPTINADATLLTDLAGYRLYYDQSSGSYASHGNVGNQTTYPLSGLTAGQRYYFVVTAYDTSGNESLPSNEASTISPPIPIRNLPRGAHLRYPTAPLASTPARVLPLPSVKPWTR